MCAFKINFLTTIPIWVSTEWENPPLFPIEGLHFHLGKVLFCFYGFFLVRRIFSCVGFDLSFPFDLMRLL